MESFSEYLAKMKDKIPEEAVRMLPMAISEGMQKWMMTYPPSFMAPIITEAINEINQGSVEKIERIIHKRLMN